MVESSAVVPVVNETCDTIRTSSVTRVWRGWRQQEFDWYDPELVLQDVRAGDANASQRIDLLAGCPHLRPVTKY